MVRLSRPPREKVKAEILETATNEFLTHGYHDARIAQIAEKAGYTKGALYSNFGSKPELFAEVLTEHLKLTEITFVPELIQILRNDESASTIATKLSKLLRDRADQLLPWQMLIAQFRLLAISDPQARNSYQTFMEFYLKLGLEICETNQLLQNIEPKKQRLIIFSTLQIINSATLEYETLSSLSDEYFSASLAAIFTHFLKELKNETTA